MDQNYNYAPAQGYVSQTAPIPGAVPSQPQSPAPRPLPKQRWYTGLGKLIASVIGVLVILIGPAFLYDIPYQLGFDWDEDLVYELIGAIVPLLGSVMNLSALSDLNFTGDDTSEIVKNLLVQLLQDQTKDGEKTPGVITSLIITLVNILGGNDTIGTVLDMLPGIIRGLDLRLSYFKSVSPAFRPPGQHHRHLQQRHRRKTGQARCDQRRYHHGL